MANISLRTTSNLLNVLPKRYASAATASHAKESSNKKQASLPKEPIRVTKLDNGIVCASLENYSPVTRIAAVFNVGARDETHDQLGATHALRVYSSLATRNYTVFGLSRTLDQLGAQLSVTSSREKLSYLLETDRRNIARAIDILGEVVSRPTFRHWEIDDARPRLDFDLDVYDETPELKFADLIHKSSFKSGGLSNALYAPRYNASNLNTQLLHQFREENFANDRLVLVGFGLKHDDLLKYSDFFRLQAKAKQTRQQAKFVSSELREDNDSDLVHVGLTGEGVSVSAKEFLASNIAAHAFGTGSRIKYSAGGNKLIKAISAAASGPVSAASFNINYSDTGLFGFHIVGGKNDIGKVVKAVHGEVAKATKNGFTNDEISRAKNSLKTAISFEHETANTLINQIASNPDQAQSNINDLFKAIDAVSANDVNSFVKRIGTSKHSLAAIGNLENLPRLEDIKA